MSQPEAIHVYTFTYAPGYSQNDSRGSAMRFLCGAALFPSCISIDAAQRYYANHELGKHVTCTDCCRLTRESVQHG